MDNSKTILKAGIKGLDIEASDAQIESLIKFVDLLQKWNKTYNLTAIRSREDMLRLHILDSLAILPLMTGKKIIDVGTGAGLPGIPLALFMPEVQFTLLDSNAKKTRFVQQAVLELKLDNVEVIHSRVEKLDRAAEYDVVMSRAFASLSDMMALASPLLNKDGIFMAMKGQFPEEELKGLACAYTMHDIKVPDIGAERCLLKISVQH